jgi:hypothetical protein
MRKFIVWREIRSEYGQGSWALIDDVVMLKTAFGQKATQRGSSPPETIARILLYELSGECLRDCT